MKQVSLAVSCASFAFGCSVAMASPWGMDPAGVLTINRIDHYNVQQSDRSFRQNAAQFYREMSVGNGVTAGVKIIHGTQRITSGPFSDKRSGIIDTEIFAQRRLLSKGRHVLSGQLLYAPKIAMTSQLFDDAIGRDAATEFGLLCGRGGKNNFATASTGYRKSLGSDADQIRAQIGAGRTFGKLQVLTNAYGTLGVGESETFGADYDLLSLSTSVVISAGPRYRFQFGATADLAGQNIDRGTSLFAALWVMK